MTVYLVEVDAYRDGSVVTHHLSTHGITTRPNDVPANTYYEPRVMDPGNFEAHMFAQGTTRGASSVGVGMVRIANGDPGNGELLDDWLDDGFDGRRIVIKTLPTAQTAVSNAVTIFTGSCEQLVSGSVLDHFELIIHDRLSDLDTPLLTTKYAGTTTSSMASAEGNADLADQTKPRLWGGTLVNVPCILANAYDLIYQVSDGAVVSIVVYDAGLALVNVGDFATIALLRAATLVPGTYATCLALGLFRLGGLPFKSVTADVTEGVSADRTAAQIVYRMLIAHGISAADILTATFTSLDSDNGAPCGTLVTGETTCLAATQQVLDSVGASLTVDHLGRFKVGRLEIPAGAPEATFDDDQLLTDVGGVTGQLERLSLEDGGKGIPAWRLTIRWGKVWQTQAQEDLAGTVTAERRALLGSQFRSATIEDAAILTVHPLSPQISIDTMLINESDAIAEATRKFAMHSVRRDAYRFSVAPSEIELDVGQVNLGSVVEIVVPRLGLDDGRLFVVIGRTDNYLGHRITMDVWGPD